MWIMRTWSRDPSILLGFLMDAYPHNIGLPSLVLPQDGAMKTIVSSSDSEKLLQSFGGHLLTTHGLAARTCTSRVFYASEFLQAQLKARRAKLRLKELTAKVLFNYVLKRSRRDSPQRLQA